MGAAVATFDDLGHRIFINNFEDMHLALNVDS